MPSWKSIDAMPEKPTIVDVARRAGVSKSLVSLVLRDAPNVSEARRRAVLEAVEALGYRPNANARRLVERRSATVGVVISDMRNPWCADFLDGFEAELRRSGMSTLIGNGRLDGVVQRQLVESFLELQVDALCVGGTFAEKAALQSLLGNIPSVVVHNLEFSVPRVDVVTSDYAKGAYLAVTHLVELGHTSIGHITGPGRVAAARRAGYEQAMRDHGVGDQILTETTDFSEQGNAATAARLLAIEPRPTGVFAVNDLVGMAVLAEASSRGIEVSDDLSVVGCDDTSIASLPQVAMTSVDAHNEEMGRIAAALVLKRVANPNSNRGRRKVTPTLAVRRTSGPPPARRVRS